MPAGSCAGSASRSRWSTTDPVARLDDYGVTGFPETFVIDREGRVVAAFAGAVNGERGARPAGVGDRRRAVDMTRLAGVVVLATLLLAGSASAAPPNAADLEAELVCPVCETTLDQSNAPIAEQMKAFIRARIAAGDSEQEIKDALVSQFGPKVLAKPPDGGFGLLAWLLPLTAVVAGAVGRRLPHSLVEQTARAAARRRRRPPRPAARAPRRRGARTLRQLTG